MQKNTFLSKKGHCIFFKCSGKRDQFLENLEGCSFFKVQSFMPDKKLKMLLVFLNSFFCFVEKNRPTYFFHMIDIVAIKECLLIIWMLPLICRNDKKQLFQNLHDFGKKNNKKCSKSKKKSVQNPKKKCSTSPCNSLNNVHFCVIFGKN